MSKRVIDVYLVGNMKVSVIEETLTDDSTVYNVVLRTEANRIEIACVDYDHAAQLAANFHDGYYMLDAVENIAHP